jgi:hypothetical protein
VTLASFSVLAAGATVAWPSFADSSNSTTSSRGLRLLVSDSADRSNARDLAGAHLGGKIAIFTNRPNGVRSVAFYLDDPRMRTPPRHVDYYWPFDFAGTAPGGTAKLFDTSNLTAGRHLVTAKAVLTGGAQVVKSAAFYKLGTLPSSTATAQPTTAAPSPTIQPTISSDPSSSTTRPADPSPVDAATTASVSSAPVASATATTQATPTTVVSTAETMRPTTTVVPPTSSVAPSSSTPIGGCSAPANTPGGSDGLGGCFPGPDNTGVPAGTNLTTYTGPCTITVANTVIDSKVVNCDIDIRATGVVIRNSEIHGSVGQPGGVSAAFRIEDSLIDGGDPYACINCGVDGRNFTILRTEIRDTNRGAYCQHTCLIQNSWVHGTTLEPVASNLAHASGVRVEQYATLIHNTLACDFTGPFANTEMGCSADLTGYPDFAPIHHNTIDGNLFKASTELGFCAYGGGTAGKPYSNDSLNATYIVFRNNVFQRGSQGKCGAYGAVTSFVTNKTGNVWQNNRWSDGASVTPG